MAVRREVLIFDHLFITGPYMMRAFLENQLLRPNDPRCIPIGFPKVDRLVDGSLDRSAILKRLGFSGKRPIVLYAPTGLKYNSLETGRGEEIIKRLRAAGRVDLLVKLHDHMKDTSVDWAARIGRLGDAHTRLVRDPDIVPYLYVADLLLTDASSVSSEYCLLDRPMVFIDVPELLESVQKKSGALDLVTWGRRAGVTASWPDEIVDAISWSLDHPAKGSPIRKAMARDLFYNPGHAADVAVRWIIDRLEIDPGTRRRGPKA
jgi:CDP-glycerol glycerophosphotransferase (TagB/SpsB family)